MNNNTCIIIEDEQLAIDILLTYIDKIPYVSCLGVFSNAMDAYTFLTTNVVDILFVDIEMPGMKGTEFVKILNRNYKIIFTTAYDEYAMNAFELNAIDYLLKPIEFNRFLQALNKAMMYNLPNGDSRQVGKVDKLFIKVDNKILNIAMSDILYIQGMQKYIQIHTKGKKYTTLLSMFKLLESLPSESFFRVHKSYIVNVNNISSIEGNMIRINDDMIPISKGQKESFFKGIHEKADILNL